MKNRFSAALKNSLILLLYISTLAGCQQGKDGDPGPRGTAGPKGAPGIKGQDGEPLVKGGSITGMVTGSRSDGTPINEPINLQYTFSSINPVLVQNSTRNYINVYRCDSLQTSYLFLMLEMDQQFDNVRLVYASYSSRKPVGNTFALVSAVLDYYSYGTYPVPAPVTGTVSNVAYNPTTGLLTGNYAWEVTNTVINENGTNNNGSYYVHYTNTSGSGKPMQLTGTFSIHTKQRTYRVRAGQ